MNDLFRHEAVFHATRRRLSGSVVLATPLSVRCLGLVLAGIVLTALIFVSVATYARKATVTGWLVPDQGLIRATASSAGFILSMGVKEGDRIERGAKLAEIQIAAESATGNVDEQAMAQLRTMDGTDVFRLWAKGKSCYSWEHRGGNDEPIYRHV